MSRNMYVCCGMSYEQSKSQSWFDILGNTTYRYTGHFGRGELAGTYDEKDCQVIHLIYPLKKSKPKIIYCSDEARRASPIVHQVQDTATYGGILCGISFTLESNNCFSLVCAALYISHITI